MDCARSKQCVSGSVCFCASLDSRSVTEKTGQGLPMLVPHWLAKRGWSGETSRGQNLLSKAVGAFLLTQSTKCYTEHLNRQKLSFPIRNYKKRDQININYSVFLFSSFLDITVPSKTHHLCARCNCTFLKQNSYM